MMLAARLKDESGKDLILLVLEPGNLEKLKRGEPIHKFLNEFLPELSSPVELLFAYSPDVEWVVKELGAAKNASELADIIERSLSRPEVVIHDKSAEELKRTY